MKKKRHNYEHATRRQAKLYDFIDLLFGTEIWAILVTFVFQDALFFIIRLMVLLRYQSTTKNYTLYFFVIKNFVLCLFELYRIVVLLCAEVYH
jgi:hypothetical protein